MKADPVLFMAYEYGSAVGLPASEVLKLPVAEFTTGFMAYRAVRNELIESHGNHNA